MKLRAITKRVLLSTVHRKATVREGRVDEVERFPPAATVEIEHSSSGWLLLRYDDHGDCVGDTWHSTVEEAKRQAQFEFDIQIDDWQEVPAG